MVEIPQGEKIVKEGERNTKVYFLIRGEVSLYSGGQHILNLRRKGDIFGERSIISDYSSLNTVIAETPVRVFYIKSRDICSATDIGNDEFHNFLYRLFALIMTDKLSLTTNKAEKYEIAQNKLLEEIAEHKRAKERLLESERKYRSLIESAPEPVVVMKGENIVYANPEAVRNIEYSENELRKMSFYDLIAPPDLDESMDRYENRKKGAADASFELRLVTKSKEVRWAMATAVEMEWEGDPAFLYFLNDITERKEAEEKLKDKQQTLSAIMNASPDTIALHDTEGTFLDCNETLARRHNRPKAEIIGSNLFEMVSPEVAKARRRQFEKIVETGKPQRNEYELDGVWLDVSGFPIFNEEGKTTRIACIIRDVTEYKQAAAERERLIAELKSTLDEVKKLSGLLPICASCKKVRDDKGYWNRIESYIEKHSEAQFSHGVCPECAEKLYGDTDWYKKLKKKDKL
ncbi:MAG: PAS domain S-box protein [Proteobacteria bacterium]|nr:PAS domain S-box protein [Pseudomonadota bacterium]